MEVLSSNHQEVEEQVEVCEICDRPAGQITAFQCEEESCGKCEMNFDKFVCSECVHTKTLEEMEEIYIKKYNLDAKDAEPVSTSKSPEIESQDAPETRNITDAIDDMTEDFSDFEESEAGEGIHADTTSSTEPNIDEEDKKLYSVIPDDTDEEDEEVEKSPKEQYEDAIDAIEQMSKPGDELFERFQRIKNDDKEESIFEKTCAAVEEITITENEEAFKKENKHHVKFSKILEEIVAKKEVEKPIEETVIIQAEIDTPEDQEKNREEYEKTLRALEKLSQLEDEEIATTPVLLRRQNGVEADQESIVQYKGPIPLRIKPSDQPNFYEEVASSDSDSLQEEAVEEVEVEAEVPESQIGFEGFQTQTKYFEDYQEDDDSGTEADMEERLLQTHQDEILERIPEDDEVSKATENAAEGLVTATLLGAVKELDRQDSVLTYTSVDKFYEERDFTQVSSDYIRGTSLEDHSIRSTATPVIDEEAMQPTSIIEYNSSEEDSDTESEYENEYYPLYEHIKAQKSVNRDIRMIRGMLEEKFKIRIISNEIDDVVKAKEEILDKFGLDLGYHEVYNYMERNKLKKRLEKGSELAIDYLNKLGFNMQKTEPSAEESALEARIMKICEYVDQGKTVDDIPKSSVDKAVKLACQYFEDKMKLKMVQSNKTWRQKQDEVIDLMNQFRKQIPETVEDDTSESDEEEIYSEMTEEITRNVSATPISFRTIPASDHVSAIDEGYEKVRKTFGSDHDVRINARIQITEDLKENIEKLSKLFPGKIKFEIETIPKTVKESITEFGAELKQDINLARHVVEKSSPSNEKFDIGAFFRNLFKIKTEGEQAV